MPPLYERMTSLASMKSRPTVSSGASSDQSSWLEMVKQNPTVNTVREALPDQRFMEDILGEIGNKALRYWGVVVGFFVLSLGVGITLPIIVGLLAGGQSVWAEQYFECQPDGTVSLPWGEGYNSWGISSILQITAAWGHMPFPVAKLIDVSWDLVVGRGGQVILTVLTYRVLSQALLYSMETNRSSFRTFSAMAFEAGNLSALWVFVVDMFRVRKGRNIRSTLLILAFVISTAYVVLFPTIASSITGYQANSEAFCENPDDGSLFSVSKLRPIWYQIKDGSRVGLTDDYYCEGPPLHSNPSSFDVLAREECELYWNQYCGVVDTCPSQVNSTWGYTHLNSSVRLSAPSLTMQSYEDYVYTTLFSFENRTITADYLKDHLQCKPTASYQWGFSSLGLFIWMLFTFVYAVTMYAVWIQTYVHSRLDRSGRRLGTYRAVVDLAAAFREEFGDECDTMSNKQFEEELAKGHAGLMIETEGLPPPRYEDMKSTNFRAFGKLGRYRTLKRQRAASRAFDET